MDPLVRALGGAASGADRMRGETVFADSLGTLITNIAAKMVADLDSRTYGEAAPGKPIARLSSGGLLEVAVNLGNAADRLHVGVGDSITVSDPSC